MNQTRSHHLLGIMPIFTGTRLPHPVTITEEEEHGENLREAGKCSDNEGVL